jgi:hypothetical protein
MLFPAKGRAPVLPAEGRDPTVPVDGRAPKLPLDDREPRLAVEALAPPESQPRACLVLGLAPLCRIRSEFGFHACLSEPDLVLEARLPERVLLRSVLRFLSVFRFTFRLLLMSTSTDPPFQLQ